MVKKGEVTINKYDAEAMYPSIELKLVIEAVNYFSKGLEKEEKKRIKDCLEMVKFGMTSTILSFRDKYYNYYGKVEAKKKGLIIGGFESAWLADLVMAFLLDQPMTNTHFDDTYFAGIYRDDGIIIFKREYSVKDIEAWLTIFQNAINYFTGINYLQFTVEI